MKKSNGEWTYFGADAAYHLQKADSADHLVNIWGADHAGTVKRVPGKDDPSRRFVTEDRAGVTRARPRAGARDCTDHSLGAGVDGRGRGPRR